MLIQQGELNLIRLDDLTDAQLAELGLREREVPAGAKLVQRGGQIVLAHSETGHHHVIESPCAEMFESHE